MRDEEKRWLSMFGYEGNTVTREGGMLLFASVVSMSRNGC